MINMLNIIKSIQYKKLRKNNPIIRKFERNFNYKFKNPYIILEALTHKSYSNKENYPYTNERLEFIGDSVLTLVVNDYLLEKYPTSNEGRLSKIRAFIISRKNLAKIANKLNFEDIVLLSKSKNENFENKSSILSNIIEAVIGAIFLDGGFDSSKKFIHKFILENITDIEKGIETINYKNQLQDYFQKNYGELPVYKVIKEEGPSHRPTFVVGVYNKEKLLGIGEGCSKKEAQQISAKNALTFLKKNIENVDKIEKIMEVDK